MLMNRNSNMSSVLRFDKHWLSDAANKGRSDNWSVGCVAPRVLRQSPNNLIGNTTVAVNQQTQNSCKRTHEKAHDSPHKRNAYSRWEVCALECFQSKEKPSKHTPARREQSPVCCASVNLHPRAPSQKFQPNYISVQAGAYKPMFNTAVRALPQQTRPARLSEVWRCPTMCHVLGPKGQRPSSPRIVACGLRVKFQSQESVTSTFDRLNGSRLTQTPQGLQLVGAEFRWSWFYSVTQMPQECENRSAARAGVTVECHLRGYGHLPLSRALPPAVSNIHVN